MKKLRILGLSLPRVRRHSPSHRRGADADTDRCLSSHPAGGARQLRVLGDEHVVDALLAGVLDLDAQAMGVDIDLDDLLENTLQGIARLTDELDAFLDMSRRRRDEVLDLPCRLGRASGERAAENQLNSR